MIDKVLIMWLKIVVRHFFEFVIQIIELLIDGDNDDR